MLADPTTPPNDPLNIVQAMERAWAYWNAGQAEQAESICRQVLAVVPEQMDALHLLGVLAHAYGHLDMAIDHLRLACRALNAPAHYLSNLAEMCRQKGFLEEAEQAGRRAVAANPDLAAAWNNLGIILQEAGKLEDSLLCLERVIALTPDAPQIHNNLGNTCKRLGHLERAEIHYAKALALDPAYAEAHSNFAALMITLGRFAQAAESARRAINFNPQLADAYLNLAAAEAARDRPSESLRWLETLLAFAPDHVGALGARAMALKRMDRLDEAEECARRAVAVAPHSADAHNILGQVLHVRDRFDETLAEYDLAARLPGTVAEVAGINRAHLLMEAGRKAEALAEFDRVVESFPLAGLAWLGRSDAKKFTAGDPDIARMESLLGPDGVQSLGDGIPLHFALAKACLDAGDSDRAFHHLAEGNRMERSVIPYDSRTAIDWMRSITWTFSTEWLRKMTGTGCTSTRPVFVVGMPRSGTTLIEQILAAHRDVHGAGELSTVSNLSDLIPSYPTGIARLTKKDLADLGRRYRDRIASLGRGRRHVVDKMPANFLHLGLIHLILPRARIIHCRRDPVDTCLSCYTKLFANGQYFSYDLTELGRYHRAYQALMAHWREVLPSDRFLEVDYETVVADLEGQARRMVAFLGLPWDESCVRFHLNSGPVRTASVNQVRQPIYTQSVGRWRPHARHLGPLLGALGITDAAD